MTRRKVQHSIYVLILLLFPLIGCNKGVSVLDDTCSIANYMNMDSLSDFWKYGYYYALLLGRAIMHLPFGTHLVAINIYSSLFVGITAVTAYLFCRKLMKDYFAFFGVFLALTMTWCPNVILYNYMTYFFFLLGVICLFLAVRTEQKKYYVIAGIVLAQSVFVRFPNVLEAALILAVWFYYFIAKRKFRDALEVTGLCVAGYVIGLAVGCILMMICGDSPRDYMNMIRDVFTLSENASGYSLTDMIREIMGAYWHPRFFLLVMTGVTAASGFAFLIVGKLTAGKDRLQKNLMLAGKIVYGAVCLLMFYWFHRRGLFFFDYNSYGSFKIIADMMLVILWCVAVYTVVNGKVAKEIRFYAAMMVIQLLITPLGSNNGTYPIINNLFLLAPFLIFAWMDYVSGAGRLFGARCARKPAVTVMSTVFLFVLLCQALNFRLTFTFQDGNDGEVLDTQVQGIACLEGMYTSKGRAAELQGLAECIDSVTEETDELIVYGQAPGLFYLLDRRPATEALWLDLETNSLQSLHEDLEVIGTYENERMPYVILGNGLTLDKMLEAGTDSEDGRKQDLLGDFLTEKEYVVIYQTGTYVVYSCRRE